MTGRLAASQGDHVQDYTAGWQPSHVRQQRQLVALLNDAPDRHSEIGEYLLRDATVSEGVVDVGHRCVQGSTVIPELSPVRKEYICVHLQSIHVRTEQVVEGADASVLGVAFRAWGAADSGNKDRD